MERELELEGELKNRVVPSALREHRQSHRFLGPCCLCPLLAEDPDDRGVFTEAAILIATSGLFFGEYVAMCAKGQCGYIGQLPLDSQSYYFRGGSRPFTIQCPLNKYITGSTVFTCVRTLCEVIPIPRHG